MADSGLAELDSMIERMKKLAGADVGARVAKKAAPLVDAVIKRTAKAGQSPEGVSWKPKKDGGRPLVNAASHVTTRAAGSFILTQLVGPDVFHQVGAGGKPVRAVIPDSGTIPEAIGEVLHEAAKQVFDEITKGSAR